MRVYLPGGGSPSRHRYLPWNRINRGINLAGDLIHALLGPFVTARPSPPEFGVVQMLLSESSHPDEDLLALADQEFQGLAEELAELQDDQLLLAASMWCPCSSSRPG